MSLNTRPSRQSPRTCPSKPRQRAFSLVEMLTVLGILAIVLGIIIPVLGKARNAARKAATQTILSDFSTAINQYQISERRLPGYFSAQDMGAAANGSSSAAGEGFSAMDNIMLDLAGGIVGSGVSLGQTVVDVGPSSTKKVRVDTSLIGSTTQTASGAKNKGYFTPDGKNFKLQDGFENIGTRASTGTVRTSLTTFSTGNLAMPAMLDSWGQPILAWAQNPAALAGASFSAMTSDSQKSKFYWASNAAFLRATKLGKIGAAQDERSLLGTGGTAAPSDASRVRTMQALIGSPAFPATPATTPPSPSTARAPVVLHSAGPAGIFLDRDSRGGKAAGTGASAAVSYVPASGTTPDPITGGAFEDVIYTAGN